MVTNCRIDDLLSAFDRKEPRVMGCHAFVSELSFLCFALQEPRRAAIETDLRWLRILNQQRAASPDQTSQYEVGKMTLRKHLPDIPTLSKC
jgi:hypothetical protein